MKYFKQVTSIFGNNVFFFHKNSPRRARTTINCRQSIATSMSRSGPVLQASLSQTKHYSECLFLTFQKILDNANVKRAKIIIMLSTQPRDSPMF